jgi:hypothetical protein
VIHVVAAVITAEGENHMKTIEEEAASATAAGEQPKATKKAARAPRRAHVAPKKGKAAREARPAKKAPRGAKDAKGAKSSKTTRDGSKTANILDLLKRPGGVTANELMKATGWQSHSVRGFLSGTVCKKMGLTVTSAKAEDGQRIYSIKP